MYATASFSTSPHIEGLLRGFQLSRSSVKWLRWIVTQEWHDLYRQEKVNDLQRFFHKYMLDKGNGWEKTPRNVVEYQADSPSDNGCSFTYTFKEYTELCGISKAKVYMSTPDHDDMDVYVMLGKLNKNGEALWHQNIPKEDLPEGTTVDEIPNHNVWRYIGLTVAFVHPIAPSLMSPLQTLAQMNTTN
ncbi:hypothetical protein H9Q70_009628 [Fusarium xylarioides]|nr:hypothetical protein H9Q70_009628 [Fusarium xylarioides]KAG5776294.1 hypothetical protein H9Q73_010039 [Fusarium xylarioides]